MNDISTDYIHRLKDATDQDEVAVRTGQYLADNGLLNRFQIIRHRIHPKPYKLLFSFPSQEIGMNWAAPFSNCPIKSAGQKWIHFKNSNYYFLTDKESCADGYLIRAEKADIPDTVEQILYIWKQIYTLLKNTQDATKNQLNEEKGNLVAQLVHDIQAIVLLSNDLEKTEDLSRRLAYQQSVNQKITFFVRDTELIKINASVKDIIHTALDLLGEKRHLVKIKQIPSDIDLEADVELFNRALNEIIENAIVHSSDQRPEIELSVGEEKTISPFIPFNWVKITVRDYGKGIPGDFLSLVKMPFFTTRKQQGSAGFGLTIAEKIINAHGGHVEIDTESGSGTQVTIYLPGKN